MKKGKLYLAVLAAAALTLAACGGKTSRTDTSSLGDGGGAAGAEVQAEAKNSLIIAKQSDPSGLDPHAVTDEAAIVCIENMYDGLFEYTKNYGEVEKALMPIIRWRVILTIRLI